MQSAKTELNRCGDARQVQRSSEAQGTRTPVSPAGSGGCTEQVMSGRRVGARAWRDKIMGAIGRECKNRKPREGWLFKEGTELEGQLSPAQEAGTLS